MTTLIFRVVTGVKFVVVNGIAQMLIQQARPVESGIIEPDTETWTEPLPLYLDEEKTRIRKTHFWRRKTPTGSQEIFDTDQYVEDFTNEKRTFNLDEVKSPDDHVVTGVKFSRVSGEGDNKEPIQLEIRVTPFDFDKGKLKGDGKWLTPNDMPQGGGPRRRFEIKHAEENKNPLESKETKPQSGLKGWVRLSRAGWVASAGQMVIPLLDGVEAAPSPPVPLSGIRLLHKAQEGYSGFLSFEISTIDMSKSIKPDNPGRPE